MCGRIVQFGAEGTSCVQLSANSYLINSVPLPCLTLQQLTQPGLARGAGTARSTSKGPGRRDSNTSFRDPHQVHGHRVTRILEIPPKTETVQLKTELLDDWKAYVNIASRGGPAEHVQTLKASLSYDPSKALVPGSGCWAAALLKHKAVMV